MTITKKFALEHFRRYMLPHIKTKYEQDGRVDHIARRECWNDYTDMLCKEGQITSKQYHNWSNPF